MRLVLISLTLLTSLLPSPDYKAGERRCFPPSQTNKPEGLVDADLS